MAKQNINVGITANDKKGDSLRAAFVKVNNNFTELYTALGLNADISLNLGAFEFTGSVMTTNDSSNMTIGESGTVINIAGDLVPSVANGSDLGSLAKPWKSLYVSNQTIYLGSVPLSLDANNNLTVNGNQVAGASLTGWTVDINNHFLPNTDILQDIGTPANRVRHIYVGPGSITIGSSVITESTTGKLVLPGITRGVNYTIDEVEEKGDQDYEFDETPLVIDAAYYDILRGVLNTPQGYQPPEYAVDDMDDGEIDGINVVSQGAGLDQTVANKMRERMRAYVGNNQDPINNFVANDWIVIPFTVSTEAADIEYETGGGLSITDFGEGFTDALDAGKITTSKLYNENPNQGLNNQYTLEVTDGGVVALPDGSIINGATLKTIAGNYAGITAGPNGADEDSWVWVDNNGATIATKYSTDNHTWTFNNNGGLTFPQGTFLGYSDPGGFIIDGAVDKDIAIYTYSGADAHGWTFGTDGNLTLPEGGDILDSNGDSVLGGGSYTPDDSGNWNDPTVNNVAAALDELAAKVAALENFEIDGGNAYTPAAGELIIDGNGA